MKIAYFSPLNPMKSGISNYSEELLPYLANYVDIDIYIDDYKPSNHLIKNNFKIRNHKHFKENKSKYDLAVYQMGNSAAYHEFIYETLLENPGLTILHDYIHFHFFIGITLKKGDYSGFKKIMDYCYGKKGLTETQKIISRSVDHFRYSMVKKIVDSSLGLIVHSEHIKDKLLCEVPSANIKRIPMGVEFTNFRPELMGEMREKYGLPKDHFIISSFGMIAPHKRIEVSLRAFARFKKSYPNIKYILVGEDSSKYSLERLIKELGIAKDVVTTGYVDKSTFQEYLHLSDICICLRYPTAGETSASMLRAMEAGKPVVISNYAQFSRFPDDCTVKVDLGSYEEGLLVEYMKHLMTDEELRRNIGENARKYVHEYHSLENAAREYTSFIEECAKKPDRYYKGSQIIEEAKSELLDLGGDKGRDYIFQEMDDLLEDLGLGEVQTPKEQIFPLKRQFQRYRYYLYRLNDYYRAHGFGVTCKLLANRVGHFIPRHKFSRKKRYKSEDRLKCNEIFEEVCILADGRAVCSCYDSMAMNVLGDVHQNRVYDIFNGPGYQKLRQALLTNRSPGLCQRCLLRDKPIDKKSKVIMPYIKALQVEVNNSCNLRCPECVMSFTKRKNANSRIMSYETFKDIIDQLKGSLKFVKFYNYGEPFLHKDCMKMLKYIKDVDPRISIYISTNGTLIDRERQRLLVDFDIDIVNFSIDGASQETYERYRVGGNLDDVLTNMRGILEYRKQQKKAKPFILWQYILFEWNDSNEEIKKAKRMAAEIGADTLMWVMTHTRGASRKFTSNADSPAELVSRKGFENSLIQFCVSKIADSQKISG